MRLLVLGTICSLLVSTAYGMTSYHIGNSLTADGLSLSFTGLVGLEELVNAWGGSLTTGYHVDSSQSLYTIWDNPDGFEGIDAIKEPYGKYTNALTNYEWDIVTLQPYFAYSSSLGLDKQHIPKFIDMAHTDGANSDTIFYIYQVWPRQSLGDYQAYWTFPYPNTDNGQTLPRRGYYELIMDYLVDTYQGSGTVIREIPTGEVVYEIAKQISAGTLPGVSSMSELYRDDIHFSTLGRYIASTTIAATILQKDPRGSTPPSNVYPPSLLTPALVEAINNTVWSVVSSHSYSGLADFNDDGGIDGIDLSVWQSAYGVNGLADADGDGDSDGNDFLVWQHQMSPTASSSAVSTSVPEPAAIAVLAIVLPFVCGWRKLAAARIGPYQTSP